MYCTYSMYMYMYSMYIDTPITTTVHTLTKHHKRQMLQYSIIRGECLEEGGVASCQKRLELSQHFLVVEGYLSSVLQALCGAGQAEPGYGKAGDSPNSAVVGMSRRKQRASIVLHGLLAAVHSARTVLILD